MAHISTTTTETASQPKGSEQDSNNTTNQPYKPETGNVSGHPANKLVTPSILGFIGCVVTGITTALVMRMYYNKKYNEVNRRCSKMETLLTTLEETYEK